MIKEIAYTAYPSSDVKPTREWYEKTLGLKFNAPFEEEGVEKYNEAKVGSGYFSLMTTEWLQRDPGTGAGITFEVENMDAAIGQLREKGVAIEDPMDTPVCRIATFEDPEGNQIILHQITVPH